MKALIVDDEPHVIAVIKLLVDWKNMELPSFMNAQTRRMPCA